MLRVMEKREATIGIRGMEVLFSRCPGGIYQSLLAAIKKKRPLVLRSDVALIRKITVLIAKHFLGLARLKLYLLFSIPLHSFHCMCT